MEPFDKVIGYQKAKDELGQIIDMYRNREAYEEMGATLPQGVLLYGDPGMGKTLLATSFIEASGLKSFRVTNTKSGVEVQNDISAAFHGAERASPAVVYFDDIDKFSKISGRDVDDPMFVTIQSFIDQFKGKGILVLATANKIEKLPSSLLRSGRFDVKISMRSPSKEDAASIVEYYLRKRKVDPSANFDDIAKMITYTSCADLDKIVNDSAILAAHARKPYIGTEDIVEAYLKNSYGVSSSILRGEADKRVASLHEAGHCAVAEVLRKGCVGIVSTRTYDGFTKLYSSPNRRGQQILIALGGKVACELYDKGRCASGCSDDLGKALNLLRDGLTQNGTNGALFLQPGDVSGPGALSDGYKARVENGIASELERYLFLCRDILIKNKGFLLALAEELYKKSTLLNNDIQRIRSSFEIIPCPDYSDPDGAVDETEERETEPDLDEPDECDEDDDDCDY